MYPAYYLEWLLIIYYAVIQKKLIIKKWVHGWSHFMFITLWLFNIAMV